MLDIVLFQKTPPKVSFEGWLENTLKGGVFGVVLSLKNPPLKCFSLEVTHFFFGEGGECLKNHP